MLRNCFCAVLNTFSLIFFLSVYMCNSLFVQLSVCSIVCLLDCLFVRLSVFLFICLSITSLLQTVCPCFNGKKSRINTVLTNFLPYRAMIKQLTALSKTFKLNRTKKRVQRRNCRPVLTNQFYCMPCSIQDMRRPQGEEI